MLPLRALLVAAPLAGSPLVAELFAGVAPTVVALDDLRVTRPWQGELFDLLATAAAAREPSQTAAAREPSPAAGAVGLLIPMRWCAGSPAPELVLVADHVNTRLRGPLTGRRPASGPRSRGPQPFPSPVGLYQPEMIRRAVGRRVYSIVAVAGVASVAHLTPFERRAVAASGCPAVCDCLVDAAIIAAFHGLTVAACGVPSN